MSDVKPNASDEPLKAPTESVDASLQSYFTAALHMGLRERHGLSPRGIIHLGAHVGAEMVSYMLAGYEKVLYVEPHPETYETLVRNVAAAEARRKTLAGLVGQTYRPMFQTRRVAAGEQMGEAVLHVASRPENNTINAAYAEANRKYQGVETTAQITVPVVTLDHLVEGLEDGWKPEDFGVLYANIEGAELLALRGARRLLPTLDVVVVETSDQVIDFGPSVPRTTELDAFLKEFGFADGSNVLDAGAFVYRAYFRKP